MRSIVLCPDAEMAAQLGLAMETLGELPPPRVLSSYPTATELLRALRAVAPDVIFLSFQDTAKAQEVIRFLEAEAEGVQIIGVHRTLDAAVLRESMRVG